MSVDFRELAKHRYGLTEADIQMLKKYEAMKTICSDGNKDLKYEGFDENGNVIKRVWLRNNISIDELMEEDIDPYLTVEENINDSWHFKSIGIN